MFENKRHYFIFCLCFVISCALLYILPVTFWVSFRVKLSKINVKQVDQKTLNQHKNTYFPKTNLDCTALNQKNHVCSYSTEKKSKQLAFFERAQKNAIHGFLSKHMFLKRIETPLEQLKELQQNNTDLELKIIDIKERLPSEDLQANLKWLKDQKNAQQDLLFSQKRLSLLNQNSESYPEDQKNLSAEIQQLEDNLQELEQTQGDFTSMQKNHLILQQDFEEHTEKIDVLLRKTRFLEQIFDDYSSEKNIPDPDQIQWKITQLKKITHRFAVAKTLYVIPLSFLWFSLYLVIQTWWRKKHLQDALSSKIVSTFLNVPFLGDLNLILDEKKISQNNDD